MTTDENLFKEKLTLLIARERELLALRRKHERLAAWLSLTRRLPAVVIEHAELPQILRKVSQEMLGELDFQSVSVFEILGPRRLRAFRAPALAPLPEIELSAEAYALLDQDEGGVCQKPHDLAAQSLSESIQLDRFLWYRIERGTDAAILIFAGFDRASEALRQPFDDAEVAHFVNAGRHLNLLLGNLKLSRELARDKRALEEFNQVLEQRVTDRTQEVETANVQLRTAFATLQQRDERLAADIEQARLFQQRILPELPISDRIEFAAVYRPLERVGGDIYDVSQIAPGRFRVFLADATGHGVQASLRTILLKSEYDRLKAVHENPSALLDGLTARLIELFPDGDMLSTGACFDIELDDSGALVTYANAANPALLHWSRGASQEIYSDGPFLAVSSGKWPLAQEFRLARGDVLIACSDGLIEQANAAGASFEQRLTLLPAAAFSSAGAALAALLGDFEEFCGAVPVEDDITVIGLRLT